MNRESFSKDFFPNPVQKQFIESRATADLFSSRRGEGKSTALAWSIFTHTKANPGAKWAVIRDTFENLQKTTMETFFEWFPPNVFGDYNQSKKRFTWYEGVADGEVHFVGMDDPTDISKFLSWELAGLAFDEPAPAMGSRGIPEAAFQMGMTCLRQPNMKWYSVKLAENNPDESHWTYRYFVDPGKKGYEWYQPATPENLSHLPPNYYENMREALASRPDLIRRFVDGEFGFQQEGQPVTPQWADKFHLATGLVPVKNVELLLSWDFGLHPACVISQRTPLGYWLILDAVTGDGVGIIELIDDLVKPILDERYENFSFYHTGDPTGSTGEQSSVQNSAVRVLRETLGGKWRPGPVSFPDRRDPLQAILSRNLRGTSIVKVDRARAKPVWYALRGGWHYHVASTGAISEQPKKNHPHSDIGDAMGYAAHRLFPLGRKRTGQTAEFPDQQEAVYFGSKSRYNKQAFIGRPGLVLPKHGEVLKIPEAGSTPARPQKGYF